MVILDKIKLLSNLLSRDCQPRYFIFCYSTYFLQSIPPEIIDTHELQAITLDYRRECQQDDIVDSLTSLEPLDNSTLSELTYSNGSSVSKKDGQDLMRFLHLLQSSGNGLEINRCRTQWRKKPAKR